MILKYIYELHFSFKSFIISTILLNFSIIIMDGTFSEYESELVESSSISWDFDFNNLYLLELNIIRIYTHEL